MSKSNKYGYVGVDVPEQSFGNNKGIFNPAEINELVADNKWTSFGQLELIETQTVSSATSLIFNNIKEDVYNVHFLTINDMQFSISGENLAMRLSTDNGSTFITSGYQYGQQYGQSSSGFGELKYTSRAYWDNFSSNITGTNSKAGMYIYLYNLGDSTKYSFYTSQSTATVQTSIEYQMRFGSGVLATASVHNAFQLDGDGHTSKLSSGTYSLYGIRYS